jgi:lysine N6-hydroxylase
MFYHCVGIGVGPANLSLASLLCEHPYLKAAFFEKRPSFRWHDGLLVDGANLQVSLFKDLVTLADPRNKFSFISYLHSQGKLYHFLNARFDDVPRREFANYMEWASANNEAIHFGEEAVSVDFVHELFAVETTKRRVTAHNLSIGVGTEPFIPEFARGHLGETQFHVADLVHRLGASHGKRVAIVGGGQSGAEAALLFLSRGADCRPLEVSWISKRENFYPLDDSPFTNDYFMPSHSDYFFWQDREYRRDFVQRNVLASDGISERTLRNIYQRIYSLQFIEDALPVVSLMPGRTVISVSGGPGAWTLVTTHHDSGAREVVRADIVIWATGIRPAPRDFLAPIAGRMEREGDEFRIDDEFAVKWDGPADRKIFILNAARNQRGLADPNLSLMAWRSQRIIDRMAGVRGHALQQHPSFVSWAQAGSLASTEREAG